MEFGELWKLLGTWQNLAIMIACGGLMEGFKKTFKKFAESPWGKRLQRPAPVAWAWAMLFIPWGLAPEGAKIGELFLLGILLGGLTAYAYSAFRGFIKKRDPVEELKK